MIASYDTKPLVLARSWSGVEAEHFLDCIRNSQEPLTGLAHARTVVSILERARPLNGEVKRENLAA
jgi:predicted dehydrogenase